MSKRKFDIHETPDFYTTCFFIERQLKKFIPSSLRFEATCADMSLYYHENEGFSISTYLDCAGAANFAREALKKIGIRVTNDRPRVNKEAIEQFAKMHKAEIWEDYQQRRNRKSSPMLVKQKSHIKADFFKRISIAFRCFFFKKNTQGGKK